MVSRIHIAGVKICSQPHGQMDIILTLTWRFRGPSDPVLLRTILLLREANYKESKLAIRPATRESEFNALLVLRGP